MTSFNFGNYKILVKLNKKYNKIYEKVTKSQICFEKVINNINCYNCENFIKDMQLEHKDRFQQCGNCRCYLKIKNIHQKEVNNLAELEKFICDVYSKEIYKILNEIKPNLIVRKTKEIKKWDDTFSNNFDDLTNTDKKQLVALIEEGGGRYRIA